MKSSVGQSELQFGLAELLSCGEDNSPPQDGFVMWQCCPGQKVIAAKMVKVNVFHTIDYLLGFSQTLGIRRTSPGVTGFIRSTVGIVVREMTLVQH